MSLEDIHDLLFMQTTHFKFAGREIKCLRPWIQYVHFCSYIV